MAAKKLPKNVDFAEDFFSTPAATESTSKTVEVEKKKAPAPVEETPIEKPTEPEAKNLGGRPKKDGLKNEQFTLTMNPETYEKLRLVADEHTRGNFSGLIDEAIKSFCREREIDLSKIDVDPAILKMYSDKQNKKSKNK